MSTSRRAGALAVAAAVGAVVIGLLLLVMLGLDEADDGGSVANGIQPASPADLAGPRSMFEAFDEVAPDIRSPSDASSPLQPGTESLPPQAPRGRLAGRVVDSDMQPLQDARVLAYQRPVTYPSPFSWMQTLLGVAVAGDDGRFEFDALPAGTRLVLDIEVGGTRNVRLDGCMAVEDQVVDIGDVVLPKAATIAGRVQDDGGRPIPGAAVVACHSDGTFLRELDALREGRPRNEWPKATALTDAEGDFALSGLQPGDALVAVLSQGHGETFVELRLTAGPQEIPPITLAAERMVHGQVLEHDGRPTSGARVSAILGKEYGSRKVITDDQGQFLLGGLGAGRIEIFAISIPSGTSGRATVDDTNKSVVVRLEAPDPKFVVRAERPGAAPVESFEAWWLPPTRGSALFDTSAYPENWNLLGESVEPGGELQIPWRPNEGRLWVTSPGFSSCPVACAQVLDDPATVVIRLEPVEPVSGTVVDELTGSPLAGARVQVCVRDSSQPVPRAVCWTDGDGRFFFESVPLENLRLVVRSAGCLETSLSVPATDREGLRVPLAAGGSLIIRLDAALRARIKAPRRVTILGADGVRIWDAQDVQATCVAGPFARGRYSVSIEGDDMTSDGCLALVEPGVVTTVQFGAN